VKLAILMILAAGQDQKPFVHESYEKHEKHEKSKEK